MSGRSVEHATFVVERKYEASPERAFAAWADPEAKARWYSDSEAHLELDFRVGGGNTAAGARRMGAPTAMRRSSTTSSRPSASSTRTTCTCRRL